MTNPPFMHEKGQPRLWMRDLTPEEADWVAKEKRSLSEAAKKLQQEEAKDVQSK